MRNHARMSATTPGRKTKRRIPVFRCKLAGVTITVQRCRVKNGHHTARVVVQSGGKRRCRYFETAESAKAFAEVQKIEAQNSGARAAVEIGDNERRALLDAKGQLAPYRKTLADAVSFYVAHLKAVDRSATISAVIAELLAHKTREKKSVRYQRDLKSRLTRFEKDFGERPAASITPEEISHWMDRLKLQAYTVNNYRRLLGVLFNYAASSGFCEAGIIKKTIKIDQPDTETGILTVAESAALLRAAHDHVRAGVVIGLFAGVRDAELRRLDWRDVDIEGEVITIGPKIAKKKQRRVIPIRPNLRAWLEPLRQLAGPVLPDTYETKKLLTAARQAVGFGVKDAGGDIRPWPHNALRHSFASYSLAAWPNAPALARAMGNSVAMILKHYDALAKPVAAAAFWNLTPETTTPRGITMMNGTAQSEKTSKTA